MAKEMLEKISGDELLRQKYYAREKARLDEISRIKRKLSIKITAKIGYNIVDNIFLNPSNI
ncbi:MAG: hypothetical protein M0Q14_05460 [Tissierellaceae bacterium]|nr:hypothetical protein [Tissierellaceae bacterium]